MQLYLPIAEMSVNLFLIVGIGGLIGFMSGLFGVGGGFLLTPALIFTGVPPAVAVGTGANELVATSISGAIAHWRRGNVDFAMGGVLLTGGAVGSLGGTWLFGVLKGIGQIELTIGVSYVVLLGTVGGLMFQESARQLLKARTGSPQPRTKLHEHRWFHGLPLKLRFRRSKLYISALLPFGLGTGIGFLAAMMGVGGGFILVPAMIYLLGMPTQLVIGTSLFQVTFVTGFSAYLHALNNQSVDIVLALLLLAGGVVGAQFGARLGANLSGVQLRFMLSVIVLALAVKLAFGLFAEPDAPYLVTRG
ncbi:MAG: sulfite exporter TauE/SafE family protein [Alphaproteobacteria bacterium]|nr:sulfite exporter TauE/SafE family protein [Alphaproteobacteria bacterium]